MYIQIMGREALEEMKQFLPKTALISIADVGDTFVTLPMQPEYLLQLQFNDVPMAENFKEELGHLPSEEEIKWIRKKYHPMSEAQAEQIAAFLLDIREKAEVLICQCEYGESRSAAIAAAFREYVSGDGIQIFADDAYLPNRSIFRKIYAMLTCTK